MINKNNETRGARGGRGKKGDEEAEGRAIEEPRVTGLSDAPGRSVRRSGRGSSPRFAFNDPSNRGVCSIPFQFARFPESRKARRPRARTRSMDLGRTMRQQAQTVYYSFLIAFAMLTKPRGRTRV